MEVNRDCSGTTHQCTVDANLRGVEETITQEEEDTNGVPRCSFSEHLGQLSGLDDLDGTSVDLLNFEVEGPEESMVVSLCEDHKLVLS
mmetsp:Transcript_14165/g.26792  ORF Transcript_14165/g.26792 Transcript_14165/m.26792 type:complete len:88 (+) Transcript_14165:390-653(+)